MSAPSSEQVAAGYEFALIAVQYHATGRFAALTGCIPVAGNLLHHAAEMYLKCALVRSMTMPELKKLRHGLPALWQAFSERYPSAAKQSVHTSIRELDKLEQLRYPEAAVATGYQLSFVQRREQFAPLPAGPQPQYHLVLEDADEVASIAAMNSGLQPSAFSQTLRSDALHYLLIGNAHLAGVA